MAQLVTNDVAVTRSFDADGWQDGSFTQYELRMVPDTRYRIGFPLWNRGRLPVTVLGLASTGDPRDEVSTSLAGTSRSPKASTMRWAGPWPRCTTTTR